MIQISRYVACVLLFLEIFKKSEKVSQFCHYGDDIM